MLSRSFVAKNVPMKNEAQCGREVSAVIVTKLQEGEVIGLSSSLMMTKRVRSEKKKLAALYSLYYAACLKCRQFSPLLHKPVSSNEGQLTMLCMSSSVWNHS